MKSCILILLGAVLFTAGCISADSIRYKAERINSADGVSKEEAMPIAQKHCLDTQWCRNIYIVSFPNVTESKYYPGNWRVRFRAKGLFGIYGTCMIYVDKNTGKINRTDTHK